MYSSQILSFLHRDKGLFPLPAGCCLVLNCGGWWSAALCLRKVPIKASSLQAVIPSLLCSPLSLLIPLLTICHPHKHILWNPAGCQILKKPVLAHTEMSFRNPGLNKQRYTQAASSRNLWAHNREVLYCVPALIL